MANANSGGHVGHAGAHRSGVCDPEATTSTHVPSLLEKAFIIIKEFKKVLEQFHCSNEYVFIDVFLQFHQTIRLQSQKSAYANVSIVDKLVAR